MLLSTVDRVGFRLARLAPVHFVRHHALTPLPCETSRTLNASSSALSFASCGRYRFGSGAEQPKASPLAPLPKEDKRTERRYPIGIDDFSELLTGGYFHWDRSFFAKDFYTNSSKNTLILRPRRWGKTMTMSMVKYFFDASKPELAKELFAASRLAKEDPSFVDQHCGKWPVVFITFAGCTAATWAEMKSLLINVIAGAYNSHLYLLDGDFLRPHERKPFEAILNREPSALYQVALQDLTALLARYYKKRVLVLIDEYDKPMHSAFENKYLDSAVPFLSSAFTGCLKSNANLEKGLLTGILKVAKYGYLSGLNNLDVYSSLDKSYSSFFGINEDEVREALDFEGLSDHFDEVRKFYDGYDVADGHGRIFNPWSMLSYLKRKDLIPYWVKAGGTDKYIVDALWRSNEDDLKRYEDLLAGQMAVVPYRDDFRFDQVGAGVSLWSLLFYGGYLTGNRDGDKLIARVPNFEVLEEFGHIWDDYFAREDLRETYLSATEALLAGDAPAFQRDLRQLAREVFSIHDVAKKPELWYHAFLLAMIVPLRGRGYHVESNVEAGRGRVDLLLFPRLNSAPGIIIEIKTFTEAVKINTDDDLKNLADEALAQIRNKDYSARLRGKSSSAMFFGVAVYNKFVNVAFDRSSVTPP